MSFFRQEGVLVYAGINIDGHTVEVACHSPEELAFWRWRVEDFDSVDAVIEATAHRVGRLDSVMLVADRVVSRLPSPVQFELQKWPEFVTGDSPESKTCRRTRAVSRVESMGFGLGFIDPLGESLPVWNAKEHFDDSSVVLLSSRQVDVTYSRGHEEYTLFTQPSPATEWCRPTMTWAALRRVDATNIHDDTTFRDALTGNAASTDPTRWQKALGQFLVSIWGRFTRDAGTVYLAGDLVSDGKTVQALAANGAFANELRQAKASIPSFDIQVRSVAEKHDPPFTLRGALHLARALAEQ